MIELSLYVKRSTLIGHERPYDKSQRARTPRPPPQRTDFAVDERHSLVHSQ
jgi:hypothetical protein